MGKSYLLIKVSEIRIAKEVKRSDAGDVSPVAMFTLHIQHKGTFPGNDNS